MSLSKEDQNLRVYYNYCDTSLPLFDAATVEYYIDTLDPYEGCRETYNGFKKDMETFGDSATLVSHMSEVMNKMELFLENHPSMIKFKLDEGRCEREKFLRTTPLTNKEIVLYQPENHFKLFIQLKLKQPYFNFILNECPTRRRSN